MAIVYIHRRNDIQDEFKNVFYVGISVNNQRPYHKRKTDRSDFWRKIVNKVNHSVEITHKDICIEEARSIEKYLICFYGRRDLNLGNLCNLTDGGEGVVNVKDTPERLQKRIQTAKEVNNREGARERMSIILKKITSNPERRKKMSEAAKEVYTRIGKKEEASERSKKMFLNPEYKKIHGAKVKKRWENKDFREKIISSLKIAQNKPEIKAKNLLHLQSLIDDKEMLKKRNEAIKKAWIDRPKITIAILKCGNPTCNKEFEQRRSFQKYCSYKCGNQVNKRKRNINENI